MKRFLLNFISMFIIIVLPTFIGDRYFEGNNWAILIIVLILSIVGAVLVELVKIVIKK